MCQRLGEEINPEIKIKTESWLDDVTFKKKLTGSE